MANKQRSFFDQKPRRQYQPWQSRRPNDFSRAAQQLPRPFVPAPPIAASSQSKSKLSAFRYNPQEEKVCCLEDMPVTVCAGKENEPPLTSSQSKKSSPGALQNGHGQKDYPRTPVTRVPFQDLIGNKEEPIDEPPQCTPADSVTWRHSPRSSERKLMRTPKGKKRARSSSPLSSTRTKSRFEMLNQPVFDAQDLQNPLMHGQMDPALDIERRYFGAAATPSRAPASATAEIMHSSSPQTPDVRTDTAKLRRTVSCGVAYPNSRTKRRKYSIDHNVNNQRTPINKMALQKSTAKVSRVSILLEKIEQARDPSFHQIDHPDRATPNSIQDESRERHFRTRPSLYANVSETFEAGMVMSAPAQLGPELETDSRSQRRKCTSTEGAECRGDELDLEPLTVADKVPLGSINANKDAHCILKPMIDPTNSTSAKQIGVTAEHDEFDDDEEMDDIFAADLEDLASKYDLNPTSLMDTALPKVPLAPVGEASSAVATETEAALPAVKTVQYIELSSDEDFGGDEFDDIAEEMSNLTQVAENQSDYKNKSSLVPRFIVKSVIESQYQTKGGRRAPEKLLRVEEHRTNAVKLVSLRESWWDTVAPPGTVIHVIASFDRNGQCTIDNANGLVIVHPDHLLSATVVADAYKCTRRAVLQDRVKATGEASESQIYGNVLHEIFQKALEANRWDDSWLESTIRDAATRHIEGLFEINVPLDLAIQHLIEKMPILQSWARLFLTTKHNPESLIKGPKQELTHTKVVKLLDVEEHIWSPKYGLKGNVDATVQVSIRQDKEDRNLLVPFEIKTGRKREQEPNISHDSQTALYTMLLSDRYDVQVAFGILYYLETSEMSRITGQRQEIAGMIQRRNELACYVRDRQDLPPMLKNPHTCSHCYAQTSCFVYHKLTEDGDGNTSGLGQKFNEAMGHLKPVHAEFFKKWDDLLTKEETDVLRFRKELWTMTSSEREKVGRCFGGIIIKSTPTTEVKTASKINRFEYVFTKPGAGTTFSFAESQINLGEPIVISDEEGHYALANGYVTRIRKHEIAVAVDRRLHNARIRSKDFDEQSNQSFAGIMEVNPQPSEVRVDPKDPIRYRLDKDEFSNGMATVRNNLIRIMENELFGAQFLRRLVVEDVAPAFTDPPSTLKKHFELRNVGLNVDQRNAISKVMEAQQYALVLGMPGTGKTTTIAHIIRALTASGKSVLLTSYTHTAVDNILLKIRNDNLSILRIGAEAKIHPEVKEFADLASMSKSTFEEVEKSYKSQVVATTCLGINHSIFNQRTFDYCIVDEASQITLPVCLGPIRMAHRFVLVGDHYQLPPLVQNKDAQEGGLDISLFKLLSDRHPESVVNLEHQYRMCEEIMSLSNTLIYSGRLKCGTSEVATRMLNVPNFSGLAQHHYTLGTPDLDHLVPCAGPESSACWLRNVLAPERRVVFINTDMLGSAAREISNGTRITNPLEVAVATQLVRSLIAVGVEAAEIGLITLYRIQLSLLKHSLRAHAAGSAAAATSSFVEMHTADKFQGRDKEVIVLSLVRSNDNSNVGELLQDWRRVNVALTRARTKLIVIGSFDTISKGNELLGKFCKLVESRGWRFDLRPQAMDEHLFDEAVTQTTGHVSGRSKQESPKKSRSPKASGKFKVPEKKGTLDPARLLKSRPVLRDIVNEMTA